MKPQRFGPIAVEKVAELPRLPLDPTWLIGNATLEGIAEERSWLDDTFIEAGTEKLIVSIHSYVVRTPRHTILVDTCCGNGRDRGPESPFHNVTSDYLTNLAAVGLTPGDIDLVFCTHLHVDHVGWNVVERDGRFVPTFPNARYLFNREDFEHRIECERTGQGSVATRAAFRECVLPLVDQGRVTFVESDELIAHDIDHDLTLVSLPGHCPGHLGLRVTGGGGQGLITGDAIHHPIQLPRPNWHCAADVDPMLSSKTRRDLIERYVDSDLVLLSGHFAGATAGRIVSRNGAVRFAFTG